MTGPGTPSGADATGWFNREVGAGVFLLLLAAIAIFGSRNLAFGQLSGVGPGLMPRVTAMIVAGFGILLIAMGLTSGGERLEPWSLRGTLLVLGAIAAFAATIRPLGLVVAGPLAVIMAALADPSTRLKEIIPFAIILSLACIGLFKYALRLPIPLAPLLLGY